MSEVKVHKVKYGNTERYSFSKIKDVLDIPYLIEVQKNSYKSFLEHGIKDVLDEYSPIRDFSGRMELSFIDYRLDGEPKYSVRECKNRDATYAVPLKVKARLTNLETGVIEEPEEIFMGDIPLMTDSGSFVINGAERVIVSQLVRSPGVYYKGERDKNGVMRYSNQMIPNHGAWLEFEQDANGLLWVHVDRQRKITATTLLRALGYGTDDQINAVFEEKMIADTCERDPQGSHTEEAGKIDLFRRMRPGEVPTLEGANILINNYFFDNRRYDLTRVGRYKFNKKLSIASRIAGQKITRDVVSVLTGEILAEKGEVITEEKAKEIQNNAVNEVYVEVSSVEKDGEKKTIEFKVIGNNTVDLDAIVDCNPEELGILEKVYYPNLKKLLDEVEGDEARLDAIRNNVKELVVRHLTLEDIVAAITYNQGLSYGLGTTDDIDHLSNRRVRSVGELLEHQFGKGMLRLERVIKERMSIAAETADMKPSTLINTRPVASAIKEFFGSSQLSQFMEQPNPIAELTHKRKVSALGPGGLSRERAGFEVRDVHHTHYGRMCPVETPEGQNIGLITSLASYARINEYGFIESPYRKVKKPEGIVTDDVTYMAADEEDKYVIAQASETLDENGKFIHQRVTCRIREDIREVDVSRVDYMDVSPKQLVSIATALIPFLENDDTNRALMGSNMQRQAVPLLNPDNAIVATGIEGKIAYDSGVMITAKEDGTVKSVASDRIVVTNEDGVDKEYSLKKFERSNNGTCINQKPLVDVGEKVKKGDIIADGPATKNGELALGKNILIGFQSWEGYNYEDAILLSEKLVREDAFTSIHIEEKKVSARDTKLGEEEITREIPNLSEEALKNLDERGIVKIGTEVKANDILVGKVTPKGEQEATPEVRLLRAILGNNERDVKDTSEKVKNGEGGIVVDVKVFDRADKSEKNELPPGVNKEVRVYIAQKRKISIGDKMAGRHGNKGIVSRILPEADMPFMADGTPLQIVLNPLGVPSRMNIGQVLEVHLGLACKQLGWKIATPVFDGAKEEEIKELLANNCILNPDGEVDGKIQLYDGRTGEPFENRATVGQMYMIKLHHLVDDKMHARSTGPYSMVTQQPLGGKAQKGGQRFGEMEVWALEAYGAAHVLQEILTVKSDDIYGRDKTYQSIVCGKNIGEPGIPESFKVLIKELQSLALDMKVLTSDKEELTLKYLEEDNEAEAPKFKGEVGEIEVPTDAEMESYDVPDMGEGDLDFMSKDLFDEENDDIDTTVPDGNDDFGLDDLFDDDNDEKEDN